MAGKARYFSSNCSKPSHRLEVSSMAMLIVTLSLIWSASIVHASDKSLQLSGKAVGKTADHSKFEILQQEFKSGPEVTKACLTCHTEAADQVHNSIHWKWEFKNEGNGPDSWQKERHQCLLRQCGFQ